MSNIVKIMKETFSGQTSNFTKTVKVGKRFGDDSLMVKLSFVKPVKLETSKKKEAPAKNAKTEKLKKETNYYEMTVVEKREKDRKFGKFVKKALNELKH